MTKYLLVQTTERPYVIGTAVQLEDLALHPRPEPVVNILAAADAPNWKAARNEFSRRKLLMGA